MNLKASSSLKSLRHVHVPRCQCGNDAFAVVQLFFGVLFGLTCPPPPGICILEYWLSWQTTVQQWDHTFPLLCSIHGIKITASVLTAPPFFRKQQDSLLLPPFVLGVRQASLKSGHAVGHRLFCPYSFRSWCGLVCLVFVAVIFKLFIYFHAYGCFAYIHACVLCVCAYYKQKAKEGVVSAGTRWLWVTMWVVGIHLSPL